jgi:hypothetical protein
MPRRCFLKVATIAVLGPSRLLSTDASALGLRGFGRGVVLNRLLSWVAGITLVATVVIGMSADARAERRVALVVGNATYNAAYMSLPSPRNDAEDISAVLKGLGLEVVTAINVTKRDMEIKLQQFARLAIDADSALFFYAGHAVQYHGCNYLMPS